MRSPILALHAENRFRSRAPSNYVSAEISRTTGNHTKGKDVEEDRRDGGEAN